MPATRTEVAHFICIGGMEFYDKRFPETREMALIDGVPTVVYHEEAKKVRLYSSYAVPVDDAQRAGLRAHKDFGTYYVEVTAPPKEPPPPVPTMDVTSFELPLPAVEVTLPDVKVFADVTTKAAALEVIASVVGTTSLRMRHGVDEIKAEAEAHLIDFPNW